jgi:hypothetical protein
MIAQSNFVSAGNTTLNAGYEVSQSFGQVFRFSHTLNNNFTIIEGVQQPFLTSGLALKENWVERNIKVYPIPSNGKLTIECPLGLQGKLYNKAGQIVKAFYAEEQQTKIDWQDLPAGSYILVFLESQLYINHQNIILQ